MFILLSGAVQFLIRVEGGSDLRVGITREPGALVGWSVFRAPYRYTASARCEQDTRVVRIPRDAFTELFERDDRCGVALLQRVASAMAARLEQLRDRLVEAHLGETEDARGTPPAATAAPRWELGRTIQFLHRSPFFEEIPPRHLGHLPRAGSFEEGQVLFTQNQPAFAPFMLQEAKVGL